MAYLVAVNLILTLAIIAVAAGFGLHAWRRRRGGGQRSRQQGDPAQDYAARRDWRRSTGKLNYSSFVYFDVDRDGRYSVGDRPMSGIVARLSGGGGHLLTARSNANGFANFAMSTVKRSQIRSPGTYKFAISVPPGWTCTSGNEIQSKDFRLIEGAPAGIGSDEMVKPVGLAPIRFLDGKAADAGATISALKEGSLLFREDVASGSAFRMEMPDDADAVTIDGPGFGRRLALSPYPTHLGVLSAARTAIGPDAGLETIDFNDVTPRGLRKIPIGYAGLNWFNLNAISRDFTGSNEGYVNGNTSGDHMCYTSSGHPAELWSERPFGFHSVMISAAWLNSEGETARIESWRGDVLLAADEIAVSALTPIHYAPMLDGITRIRFSSKHSWQLVLDDLVLAR